MVIMFKKCASILGIAGDIYWTDLDNWSLTESDQKEYTTTHPQGYAHQLKP